MPDGSFVRLPFAAIAVTAHLAATVPAVRAEPLIIQGSSTFSNNLLIPNQAAIEALTGQSLKIVALRSDLGLLRLLAGQAEFAVISTSLEHAIDSLKSNSPDLPYDRLMAFPVSHVRVAFAVNPGNPVRKADMKLIRQVLSGDITNWKDLGRSDEPIRVAYVQSGGGVTLRVVWCAV